SDLLFGSNVRRQGGHRRFTEEQLRIVRAAAVLRNLGVGVEELRELVEGGGEDIARELRARIALLDESVEALRGLKLRTA
ncbi:MAG TPA: MerR family transcriptional regulator, partial [Actinomycetota bacterium]|nr:MerR family transcriptional regulator [Actinomycetota bacterium]